MRGSCRANDEVDISTNARKWQKMVKLTVYESLSKFVKILVRLISYENR